MNILHTSDWHIGRTLYGRKRHEEFEAFFNWLTETIHQREIDVLLVAGDVFDTSAPSNYAQTLYYRFLCQIAASPCRHVVIIAGNHDSPSFLNAPQDLLKALDVHVLGNASSLENEVLVLRDKNKAPELIVCAVPYLRDRDIRTVEAGESIEDKERKVLEGIRKHYAAVAELAEQKRAALQADIPIIGMGHLFAAGGHTLDDDGVRELYIGSLARVSAGIFPACFRYLALGHLHVPQKVNGLENIRYSGSPLPMGFGEAKQQKSLCLLVLRDQTSSLSLIEVPVFQKLERVTGNWRDIEERLRELSAEDCTGWLEIIYEGDEIQGDLRARLEEAVAGTRMEILRVKNRPLVDRALARIHSEEQLSDLSPDDMFKRCLAAHEVPEEQWPELLYAYQETLASLEEDDSRAQERDG